MDPAATIGAGGGRGEETREDEEEEEEEVWESFDVGRPPPLECHEVRFRGGDAPLRYRSRATGQLTPLDVTYDDFADDSYDGTGTIVWMGALAILPVIATAARGSSVEGGARPPVSFFGDGPAAVVVAGETPGTTRRRRVCELGCGAGVAGMAIAHAFSFSRSSVAIGKGAAAAPLRQGPPLLEVVLTDNDPEALNLCRENCRTNGLASPPPEDDDGRAAVVCRHALLQWAVVPRRTPEDQDGPPPSPSAPPESSPLLAGQGSFDAVVATDVLYEIVMIPPLLVTASRLLGLGGRFWLSHVPRFYLPRKGGGDGPGDDGDEAGAARAMALESHIVREAARVGLVLVDEIRPARLAELAAETVASVTTTPGGAASSAPSPPGSAGASSYHQFYSLGKLQEVRAVVLVFSKEDTLNHDISDN